MLLAFQLICFVVVLALVFLSLVCLILFPAFAILWHFVKDGDPRSFREYFYEDLDREDFSC